MTNISKKNNNNMESHIWPLALLFTRLTVTVTRTERVLLFMSAGKSNVRYPLNWPVLSPGSNNRLIMRFSNELPGVSTHTSLHPCSLYPFPWWMVVVSFTHHREKWLGWHLCEGEISTIPLTYCSIKSCSLFGDITELILILHSVHTLNYTGPHFSLQIQIQPTLIQSDTAYTK